MVTLTSHPTFTSLPTFTESPKIIPTSTFTPRPTLSFEQYPKLADFILLPDDIPDEDAYFRSYFWGGSNHNISPSTKDLTPSLKEQNLCQLDCFKIEWIGPDSYADISLIRKEREQEAIKASFDLCTTILHDFTLHWVTPWAPSNFDDCQSEMASKGFTPHTWILGANATDVYGSILIVVKIGLPQGGDDYTIYSDTARSLLEYQFEKLNMLNFPVSESR